ncbi:hypothetical protein AB0K51_24075 [Kitasatospora sp. NPDC049285]|uniref:hypothetical protein n=1 Tax=Kitasatospora sp. NPDC049285 TaxID=3157096 RepID=UPI003449EE68
MGWKDAAAAAERALENREARHPDPYLELLRLGVQHTDEAVQVTLIVPGAIVTGRIVTLDQWEHLMLKQLKQQSSALRNVAGNAMGALDDRASEQERPRPDEDSPFIHLRDVTYRASGVEVPLPTWRGPITGLVGWTVGTPG